MRCWFSAILKLLPTGFTSGPILPICVSTGRFDYNENSTRYFIGHLSHQTTMDPLSTILDFLYETAFHSTLSSVFNRVQFNCFFDYPQVVIARKGDSKQAIYNEKKREWQTKHHKNINQLLCICSLSLSLFFFFQKRYVTGFYLYGQFSYKTS